MTDLAREYAPSPPNDEPARTKLAQAELPLAERGLLDGRFTFIDGLRGIAALAVAAFHFYRMSHLSGPSWIMWPTSVICTHGDLGVSIFFVISGFVMAHSLRNAWISPKYFGNFVFRRSLRLDPPYWTVIGLALLAQWLMPAYAAGPPQPVAIWPHFFYLQDILGPHHDNSIIGVFWTLCLEVQFYLVFVICLCLVQQGLNHFERRERKAGGGVEAPESPSRRKRFEAAAMIVFVPLLLASLVVQHVTVQSDLPGRGRSGRRGAIAEVAAGATASAEGVKEASHPRRGRTAPAAKPAGRRPGSERGLSLSNWKRGFFLRYWYTFALGVLVYWVLGRAVRIWWLIGGVIAIGIMMALDWRDQNALDHTAMVLATGAMIFGVGKAARLGKWFGNRVLQYLGRISYSLYLIHLVVGVPFVNWLIKLQPPERGKDGWISWLHFFAGLAVSIIAADIIYRLIERPAVKFSKRFKPRRPTDEPGEPVTAEIVRQALPS